MSPHKLVDPELLPMIELVGDLQVNAQTLPSARNMATWASQAQDIGPAPELVSAPGRDGAPEVPIRLHLPSSSGNHPRPAILYIHGGGFVLGSASMGDLTARQWAKRHGLVVAAVDYRLAPETRFPGALDDCYAALEWLAEKSGSLGIDSSRIVVVGISAGGGLATALALLTRDRGGPTLAGQVLVYPMLDDRVGGPDDPWRNPTAGKFCWTPANNQFGWSALRGEGNIPLNLLGYLSPARSSDLSGLPRTFVGVGALDLFMDEDLDYVRRLAAAGVTVDARVYAGAPHGFDLITSARVSKTLERDVDEALVQMIAR